MRPLRDPTLWGKGARAEPNGAESQVTRSVTEPHATDSPEGLAPFPPVSASATVRVAAAANPSLGATV